MSNENKINYSICALRIMACLFIVWNHTSSYMLDNAFNKISWANIGVQIFFFMSGYLYSNKEIDKPVKWFKKNALKIMKPYWIYLVAIIPIIYMLDASRLSVHKVLMAFLGLQGFGEGSAIEGLGQHWFISYILLCYLITPLLPKICEKIGGYRILGAMILSQAVTIPFALLLNFKVAYIWTYVCGYIYGKNCGANIKSKEKKNTDSCYYIIAIIGLVVRLVLDEVELNGIFGTVSSLLIQWIKLFQGGAIFICVCNCMKAEMWNGVSDSVKKCIYKLSGYCFEVYIVHEIFVHDIFTQFIPYDGIGKICVVWMAMAIATVVLVGVEKLLTAGRNKIEKSHIFG